MDAIVILDEAGNEELVTDSLQGLLEELAGVASDLGCADELAGVRTIIEMGASYQRQRQAHGVGGYDAVVAHLVAEFEAGRPLPVQ